MENLIIIPTYNESENVKPLVEAVFKNLPDVTILFIDDNSPDGTGKVIDEVAKTNEKVKVLHREGKLGLATAYVAGYKYALTNGFKYVCGMDCDFSHDPIILPDIFREIKTHDMVLGSRYIPGGGTKNWGLMRRFVSWGGNSYARLVLWNPIHDLTGAYTCFKRETLEGIDVDSIKSRGYVYNIEIKNKVQKKGYSYKEIPFIFEDRRVGQSKMSGGIFLEAFLRVLKLRFKA